MGIVNYLWITFGSSIYARLASTNTKGQPEPFGGITSAEDGSALKAGPAAVPWNSGSNGLVNVLVDSGASGHYFDDAIIPGLRSKLDNYQVLDVPRIITTAGGHQLEGIAQGLLRGNIIDGTGAQRLV